MDARHHRGRGATCAALFEANPQQFKTVGDNTATALGNIRYRTGKDENRLDARQRQLLMAPLMGQSDGRRHDDTAAPFHQSAHGVRKAAVDFVQRVYNTGEVQLRNAFREFREVIQRVPRDPAGQCRGCRAESTKTQHDEVVQVLQDGKFAGGLGLPPAPSGGQWPRSGLVDGDGAALIEELSRRSVALNMPIDQMTESEFAAVQRLADSGADTIAAVVADANLKPDANADAVIDLAYRWWTAIRDLRGTA